MSQRYPPSPSLISHPGSAVAQLKIREKEDRRPTETTTDPRMSGSHFPLPLSYSSGQGAIGPSVIHSPQPILSPDSASSIYASPDSSSHQPFYLAKSDPDDEISTGSSATAGPSLSEPLKKKQKRNKPTLSCYECVERKTKVST